jgi:hypothetical protein
LFEQQRQYRSAALGMPEGSYHSASDTGSTRRVHSVFGVAETSSIPRTEYSDVATRRSRRSFIGLGGGGGENKPLLTGMNGYGAIDDEEQSHGIFDSSHLGNFVAQIPAIAIVSLLILMTAVPFGVAYFPIGWSNSQDLVGTGTATSSGDATGDEDDIHGVFPVPGKASLGIRMCLFATVSFVFRLHSPLIT